MIKDILVLPGGKELSAGAEAPVSILSATYSRKVNAGENFAPGDVCCAQLEVKLLDTAGTYDLQPGTQVQYYRQNDAGTRHLMGAFYVEDVKRTGKHTLSFTAWDAMARLEEDITSWLSQLTAWPYTITSLLTALCNKFSLSKASGISLCNGSHKVVQFARSTTGRQLLGWIAQANGLYAYIDSQGKLNFGGFTNNSTPITLSDCKRLTLADAPCAPIVRVAICQDESDIGVVWPKDTDGECLRITDNPLLAAVSLTELESCAKNLHSRLAGFTYTPFEAEVFAQQLQPQWQPGQLVQAGENAVTCAIFSMTLTGTGAKLASTGAPSRQSATALSARDRVQILQGQMARVEQNITGITAQVGKVTSDFTQLQVGGRNLIRSSVQLDDPTYYFVSGSPTTEEQTLQGNPLRISDADPGDSTLQLQVLDAQDPTAVSVTCCGKNLLPYPYHYSSTTISGVTFTVGSDGVVTANGTATERTVFYFNTKTTAITVPAGTKLTLSGTPGGGGKDTFFLQGTNESAYVSDFGSGVTFTASGGYRFYIVVNAGVTVSNVKFRPQVEVGSAPTAYEKYVGTVLKPQANGTVEQATTYYPVTTLVASAGTLKATYPRISILTRVPETPPEGSDPVLRLSITQLPDSFVLPKLMAEGEEYTLSLWLKGTGRLQVRGKELIPTDDWQKHQVTFIAQGVNLILRMMEVGQVDIYHPQLEKGNMATDWSAAPEDAEGLLITTIENISKLQIEADKISAQVTETETTTQTDLELLEKSVKKVKKQAELAMTSQQVQIAISTAISDGVEKVVTRTGYTFDEDGLTIDSNRSDIRNHLDHTGMQVMRGDDVLLQADNKGVTARDVTVDNYLIVGSHARLEDYPGSRTACFWI